MNIPEQYIRVFPSYESVFEGDLERCRRHLLPLVSVNLKWLNEEEDEWVHFVSAKEIYEGSVGQSTADYHTNYTREDTLGFDVTADGKYRFEADWNYFLLERKPDPELEQAYADNGADYAARKLFFEKHGHLYPYASFFDDGAVSEEDLYKDFINKKTSGWGTDLPEINGVLDDLAFQSDEEQQFIKKYNESIEEMQKFEQTNLLHVPKTADGETFAYVGRLTGYLFQAYGADSLYLFYDRALRKAVVCFEYT